MTMSVKAESENHSRSTHHPAGHAGRWVRQQCLPPWVSCCVRVGPDSVTLGETLPVKHDAHYWVSVSWAGSKSGLAVLPL